MMARERRRRLKPEGSKGGSSKGIRETAKFNRQEAKRQKRAARINRQNAKKQQKKEGRK